jgi:hypothetical protein
VNGNGFSTQEIDALMNRVDNNAMDIDDHEPAAFSNLTDEEKDQELQVIGSGLMEDSDVSGNAHG